MKKKIRRIFNKSNIKYFLLFLIVILGTSLRLNSVISNSFAFTYDVGRDLLAVSDIVSNLNFTLIGPTTGVPGVFYGPWWYYFLVPFFLLFGGNPQGIALAMSLIGVASILLAYYFGRKIGSTSLGLLFAFFISISPKMISLSSQIWNPNIAPFLVLLVAVVLEIIYSNKRKASLFYFFLLGFLTVLNVDVEILWGLLFSIGIFVSLFLILRKQFGIKKILLFISGGMLVLLPRIIFELRNNFLMSKSFLRFLSAESIEDKLDLYHFLENRILVHLDHFSNSFLISRSFIELFLVAFIFIMVILFYKKAPEMIKNFILTFSIILAMFYIGSVVFSHALWPHYFVGIPVIYIFFLSTVLFLFSKRGYGKALSFLIVVFIFLFNFNSYSFANFKKPLWKGDASVYRNQLQVIDYIYNDAKGENFKYELYTPPVFDNTYKYLFRWYGGKKYNYEPSKKASIMYFIIEPDPGYPDRPIWWLEAREQDGIILNSEELGSGVTIQKRLVK